MALQVVSFEKHGDGMGDGSIYGAARGRNGWFDPREAHVWLGSGGTVYLDIYGRILGKNAPIQVGLPKEEAVRLAEALLAMARE